MNENVRRGDVFFVTLPEKKGSVQAGHRPVVVVQNNMGNKHSSTVIVLAITSVLKRTDLPVHVCFDVEYGLSKPFMVEAEQVFTMNSDDLKEYVGHVDMNGMRKIEEALLTSLALNRVVDEKVTERINQMRWEHAIDTQPHNVERDALELTLCPVCASQFFNSPEHIIRRVDQYQIEKELCTYCNVRYGWDFQIKRKVKRIPALEEDVSIGG